MRIAKIKTINGTGYKSRVVLELDNGETDTIEVNTLVPESLEGKYFNSRDEVDDAISQSVCVIENVRSKSVLGHHVSLIQYRIASVDMVTSEKFVAIPGTVPKICMVMFLEDFKRFVVTRTNGSNTIEKEVIPFHKGSAIHCDMVDILKAICKEGKIPPSEGSVFDFELYARDDGLAVLETAYYSILSDQWVYLEDKIFDPSNPKSSIELHLSSIIEKVNKHGFEPDSIAIAMTQSCAILDFKIS